MFESHARRHEDPQSPFAQRGGADNRHLTAQFRGDFRRYATRLIHLAGFEADGAHTRMTSAAVAFTYSRKIV
jgi:hypothetical protein